MSNQEQNELIQKAEQGDLESQKALVTSLMPKKKPIKNVQLIYAAFVVLFLFLEYIFLPFLYSTIEIDYSSHLMGQVLILVVQYVVIGLFVSANKHKWIIYTVLPIVAIDFMRMMLDFDLLPYEMRDLMLEIIRPALFIKKVLLVALFFIPWIIKSKGK